MGGALGGVVSFAPASFGTLVNNPTANGVSSSCLAATRPGLTSYVGNGLPGMNGGRRKSKKSKQRGGAYGFGGASIGCTGASSVAIPASGAADSLNKVGSSLWDGPATSALQRGGGEGSVYQLGQTQPTAAWTKLDGSPDSVFQTSAGTLESVNIPLDGRMAGNCGMRGGRRTRKSKSKKSKKSKKSRRN